VSVACSLAEEVMHKSTDVDECLLPYLNSLSEATEEAHLDHLLIGIARPIAQHSLQRAFQQDQIKDSYGTSRLDVHDAISEVLLKILQRLRLFKGDPTGQPISNYRGLVATTAYRTLTDQLRGHHRQRANQDKRIRRFFAANNNLAIWKDEEGELLCGYAICRSDKLRPKGRAVDLLLVTSELRTSGEELNTGELILLIFDKIGGPVRFNDLASVIFADQEPWPETVSIETASSDDESFGNDPQESFLGLERRLLLHRLFEEIQRLSAEQRNALLLNMTDSHGYSIEWFLFANIATDDQLAALLEVSVDKFRRLIDGLPMTDKEIGRRLGKEPMKVANIRKAVRDRLKRCRRVFCEEDRKMKPRR